MKAIKPMLVAGLLCSIGSVNAADLKVDVSNIDKVSGSLMAVLYDNAGAFEKGGEPVQMAKLKVTDTTQSLTFGGLKPGTYAVKLYHDQNGNGKLDTNFLGIPSEGYGFSNNGGAMGPASYKESAVKVTEDTHIDIRLR